MGLVVVRPGVATTVQDRGRTGHRAWGVPVGGAFDLASFGLANALLGNDPADAALELTLIGGEYRARVDLALALAGAPMAARVVALSGRIRTLAIPQSFAIGAGDRLELGGTAVGSRAYLAVRGGWRTPDVLGGRSSEARLVAGDILPAGVGWCPSRRPADWPWTIGLDPGRPIRVVDGPDFPVGGSILDWATYVVSPRSDRMGLRLDGPPIAVASDPDRPSMAVAPGAIQLAGGQPLILGVACGTMGGYPHVAHVITADLRRLAQLRPGDSVRFARIALAEARRIDRDDRSALGRALRKVATIAADPT